MWYVCSQPNYLGSSAREAYLSVPLHCLLCKSLLCLSEPGALFFSKDSVPSFHVTPPCSRSHEVACSLASTMTLQEDTKYGSPPCPMIQRATFSWCTELLICMDLKGERRSLGARTCWAVCWATCWVTCFWCTEQLICMDLEVERCSLGARTCWVTCWATCWVACFWCTEQLICMDLKGERRSLGARTCWAVCWATC